MAVSPPESPELQQAGAPPSPDALAEHIEALELLVYTDAAAALASAVEAERVAQRFGRTDLELQARLVRGDALDRLGNVGAGGKIAREVNRWATEHGHRPLLARSHRLLAWFFNMIGDHPAHLEHAVRAVEFLDEDSPTRMRATHTQTLAIALVMSGSYEESRTRFAVAEGIAVALGDLDLQIAILNNRAYAEYWAGDAVASMAVAARMLALAAEHDRPLDIASLDTVARAQIALGRYAEAEQTLLGALAKAVGSRGSHGDPEPQILLTLAQAQRLVGATDRARATLDRCLAHCEEQGLPGVRVGALQERAELLALEGAYQEAYAQHKIFHAESEALQSAERDVRARTLQTVYETDEARRDSLRFREMSVRDPLTGLYNRRFVDERLDTLLREAAGTGAALSVGLLDLDYFKEVNDTRSHEIGDEVLRQVAGLLAEAVVEPAFVARLGGEEFLLVLPGCGAQEALARCETVRLRLRSHAWTGPVGQLRITTSIGVASVAAGRTSRSALLADADRNLYAAKRAGRDRVVAG
jgi:two-component system cell cycle response regulator